MVRTLLILTIALAFLLPACTGYEDGPIISFADQTERLATSWEIQQALLNGREITETYDGDFWTFESNGIFRRLDEDRVFNPAPFTQPDTLAVLGVGEWEYIEGVDQIEMLYAYFYDDPFNADVQYRDEQYEQWNITRLTEEELWLENDSLQFRMVRFQ